jgi:hypothetical protein
MAETKEIGAMCHEGCDLHKGKRRFVDFYTSLMCCEEHQVNNGLNWEVVEGRSEPCNMCQEVHPALSLNFTKDEGMVCDACLPQAEAYDPNSLPTHAITEHMKKTLDSTEETKEARLVSRIVNITDIFAGNQIPGYSKVTIALFRNGELIMVLEIELHDENFQSYYNNSPKRLGNQLTMQLSYLDSLQLKKQMKLLILHSLFLAVRDLYGIKSIHLYSKAPGVNSDYIIFGSYANRLGRGEKRVRTEQDTQSILLDFYDEVFALSSKLGLAADRTSIHELISKVDEKNGMVNIPMHPHDCLFYQAGKNRTFANLLKIKTKTGLMGWLNRSDVTEEERIDVREFLEKNSIIINLKPRDSISAERFKDMSLPKPNEIGVFMMDRDAIYEQSLYNKTGFHIPESVRQSTQILLRNLFDNIYENFRCCRCQRFLLREEDTICLSEKRFICKKGCHTPDSLSVVESSLSGATTLIDLTNDDD